MRAAFVGLLLGGCGLFAKAPAIDPCATEITRLEALRDQEVIGACAGQSFDACAPVIDRINAKYAPAIMTQIRCGADQ